ncbi:hypothetical protein CAPTEDRAFT_126294, partial [Capitella teleta]
CKELQNRGHHLSGVYNIWSPDIDDNTMKVYCDMVTDGGGWLVIQRRKDGSQDFNRNWAEYATGFGDLSGEFWLGNQNLHSLTSNQEQEVRIDLKDYEETAFAKYATFSVGTQSDKFRLSIGGYSGDAGDSMGYHDDIPFSTKDADNDNWVFACAITDQGGWWYNACQNACLNCRYLNGSYTGHIHGTNWGTWKGSRYSIQYAEMKIRPRS